MNLRAGLLTSFDPIAEYDRKRTAIAALRHDTWQEKYDRRYREFKPREQFGKTFSARYHRSRVA